MILYAVIALLVLGMVAQSVILYLVLKLHKQTVDLLTSKIMARDLNEYAVATPAAPERPKLRIAREEPNRGRKPGEQQMVALDEADPEEVMKAVAFNMGRGNEYEAEE